MRPYRNPHLWVKIVILYIFLRLKQYAVEPQWDNPRDFAKVVPFALISGPLLREIVQLYLVIYEQHLHAPSNASVMSRI